MKKAILFLLIISAVGANAQSKSQSLKDLLYSGKLKMDSNTVVRKGDDLSTKIDTSTKKPAEPEKTQSTAMSADTSAKKATPKFDSATTAVSASDTTTTAAAPTR